MLLKAKRAWKYIMFFVVSVVLLVTATATFAWLSSTWTSGSFILNGSRIITPSVEVWTYHDHDVGSEKEGWYVKYSDTAVENPSSEKIIQSIGSFDATTYTPTDEDEFYLYFGTINNLAQEQDNLPVYLKFKITLPAESYNKIIVDYSTESGYLNVYKANLSNGVGTLNDTLSETLSDVSAYPFLNMTYVVTDNTGNYSISDGDSDVPEGLTALLDGQTAKTYDFTTGFEPETVKNSSVSEVVKYLYVRFTVNPDTLQSALANTDLKANIPAYLIFRPKFSVEVRFSDIETETSGS